MTIDMYAVCFRNPKPLMNSQLNILHSVNFNSELMPSSDIITLNSEVAGVQVPLKYTDLPAVVEQKMLAMLTLAQF